MSAPTKLVPPTIQERIKREHEALRQPLTELEKAELSNACQHVLLPWAMILLRRLLWQTDAAPDADAGRMAELKRQLDASLAIAQLERRIERALLYADVPAGASNPRLEYICAILRGEADA